MPYRGSSRSIGEIKASLESDKGPRRFSIGRAFIDYPLAPVQRALLGYGKILGIEFTPHPHVPSLPYITTEELGSQIWNRGYQHLSGRLKEAAGGLDLPDAVGLSMYEAKITSRNSEAGVKIGLQLSVGGLSKEVTAIREKFGCQKRGPTRVLGLGSFATINNVALQQACAFAQEQFPSAVELGPLEPQYAVPDPRYTAALYEGL